MKQNKGQFIVFEGLDKAGKTTLAKKIIEKSRIKNKIIYQKGVCSDTFLGNIARHHPSTSLFLLECYLLSFKNYFRLKNNINIVQDRYYFSVASHVPLANKFYNRLLIKISEKILPPPDILIYCIVSKEERLKRLLKDSNDNKHHQELIKNHYLIDAREETNKYYFNKNKGYKILVDTTSCDADETALKILEQITRFNFTSRLREHEVYW